HISVPIVLSDGSLFGTFCCFGHSPAPSLSERDVTMLRIFADVTARRIERDMLPEKLSAAKAQRIRSLIVA
ncbi:GAF domain-containing protein, partial [[Ruminococcus] torques]|uniref:GAF domain-containing protein n=1 Tax=[Ruminococcus] torques TaxID=33039 RepID=UPI001EDED19D